MGWPGEPGFAFSIAQWVYNQWNINMLNNIGPTGLILILFLILLVVVLPIFLISRSSRRKAAEQTRIADALEEIAKSKKDDRS